MDRAKEVTKVLPTRSRLQFLVKLLRPSIHERISRTPSESDLVRAKGARLQRYARSVALNLRWSCRSTKIKDHSSLWNSWSIQNDHLDVLIFWGFDNQESLWSPQLLIIQYFQIKKYWRSHSRELETTSTRVFGNNVSVGTSSSTKLEQVISS